MIRLSCIAFAGATLLLLSGTSSAQGDIDSWEIYGGFSHARIDTGLPDDDFDFGDDPFDPDFDFDDIVDERVGANGFELALTGNFSRYLGAKFDVSGHFRDEDIFFGPTGFGGVDQSIWNVQGGIQVKNNSDDDDPRFRPFAHALVGAAIVRTDLNLVDEADEEFFFDDEFTDTGLAATLGAGVDLRASDRFDIRIVQLDYNPTRLFGQTQHNFRIGFGIVFH